MLMWNADKKPANWVQVPTGYRRSRVWAPEIGDIFPNFSADSTKGRINFHNWAEGSWTYFFSHPSPFTAVCSTELASLASALEDARSMNLRVLGLTRAGVNSTARWIEEIEEAFGIEVDFPVIADKDGRLSRSFGLIHEKELPQMCMRKGFFLDPALRVRLMTDYPAMVGRATEEVLRVVAALQTSSETGLATPADWNSGDYLVAPPQLTDEDMDRRFGAGWNKVLHYLKVVHPRALSLPD